jgi:hypothetical protein
MDGGKTLLDEILAFCRRHQMPKTQFGSMAIRSPSLVDSMIRGRRLRPKTEKRIREFMAADPPKSVSRRASVARKYAAAVRRTMQVESAAREFRAIDPVEQAKTAIRKARFHCFEAEITRPSEIG